LHASHEAPGWVKFKNQTTAHPALAGKGDDGCSHVAEQAQETRASVSGLPHHQRSEGLPGSRDVIGPESTL